MGEHHQYKKMIPNYFLLLLCLCISFLPQDTAHGLSVQSPHQRYKRSQIVEFSQSVDSPEVGIPLDLPGKLDRQKRDVGNNNNSASSKRPIDAPIVTNLQDSHNQLVVYWAGNDVIICLSRDIKSLLPSALYVSTNYGSNFVDVSSQLLLDNTNATSFPTLDKFFNHPKSNGRFIFTDVRNNLIFTTTDFGAKFVKIRLDFTPDEVSFDPNSDETLLAYETSTKERRLYVSLDFGVSWKLIEESVKSLAWDDSVVPTTLYIGRSEPNNEVTLLSSASLFLDPTDKTVLLTGIEEFELKDSYMFATKRKSNGELQLLISYKRGKFLEALFPNESPSQHFHIADVSNGQMFVTVTHNETVTNLYIGNEPADSNEPPKFALSLERIVFFKPNLTWSGSWLNDVTEHPFVELHRIEGLRGVYIASQFKSTAVSGIKFGLDQIQSLITFDQGGIWGPLHTPDVDNDGEPIYCKLAASFTKVNCSLHISQRVSELYPLTRAVPILSQKSALGIVMATGTVDNSLKGHLGVFMSTDGAAHWKQVLKGNYLYNFGDHGGLIVAVKYYKQGALTNNLIYSTDEGNSWETFQFYNKEIRVLGLMTEPGENTTVFFIFGSDSNSTNPKHSWVLIKVDMKNAFDRQCKTEDYKEWSPSDSQPGARRCLLGQTDLYERRRPNVSCYNGAAFTRHIRSKPCLCKRSDFECDFGYKQLDSDPKLRCTKDTSETSVGTKSEWCKPGDLYYSRTKGYRKIPGDTCEGGEADVYLPTTVPCAVKNESEFMIVAKRDSVLRIDLNDYTRVEVLPLGNVRAVVAIDFDLKRNCIYWSDVNKDHIMRLYLDGNSTSELLVSEDLKSVEGLAFDWMAQNLYFVDGTLKKIEVIKTDVSTLGRLRKKILGSEVLDKPRGIAVHPGKGYLFWTDWSNTTPYIGRSGLDGSNPQRIVTNVDETLLNKTVKWPNGITVDVTRDLIYWVDANTDTIYTADLDGNHVKAFLVNEVGVSHPFAVGVYKNFVYWDDWTTRSIYTTRTDLPNPKDVMITIQGNLSRLMDLKVYGLHSQTGTNQCSGPTSSNTCKHLCLARPDGNKTCGCPDGLSMSNGECLCPDGKAVENGTCVSNCNYTGAFKCKSGFCILPRWRCDGQPDCGPGDDSDEENCDTENTCAENQFRCVADGKCIPIHWACDLDVDCEADGSDEMDCSYSNTCNSDDHFQCRNRQCISSKWRCDGEDDCGDSSDEQNCTTVVPMPNSCKVDEFQCDDKRCISNAWVCDGDKDCLDGSDEKTCAGIVCPDWKFQCGSGECIRKSWMCDDDYDCSDHSDEKNCTSTSGAVIPPQPPAGSMFGNCSEMEQMFQCSGADKLCIPKFWVNDGIKDCPEGDDELDEAEEVTIPTSVTVRPSPKRCPDDHFQCNSGECMYESQFCDGVTDCPDGSDEPATCDSVFERDCPKGFVKCGLSSICIRVEKLHDDVIDCPNGFDAKGNTTIILEDCSSGQFRCDVDVCLPLYQFCDGKANCMDASDEQVALCKNHKPVYQVAGISVEQLEGYNTFFEWWLPSTANGQLEFLPSYCEVVSHICRNATSWTKQRRFELGSEATKRFTNYSATVYVRRGDEVYPPAVYSHFVTLEGESSPPYNLTVYQPDVSNLCVSWNRPSTPNGDITKYSVYFTPPTPPVFVVSLTEKMCLPNKPLNPNFIPGTNYSFWVTATNGFGTSKPSKAVSYVFHDDVAEVINASVKVTSDSFVTLEWTVSPKGVSGYEINYSSLGGSYNFPTKLFSKINSITIEKLPPGTKFRYTIVPVHNDVKGAPFKGIFATKGKPLPKVDGLKLVLSPKNLVTVTWTPVVDDRSKSWKYIVVYGKSIADITTRQLQVETKETRAYLKELEACENYFVVVGVFGLNGGVGPLSFDKQIRTAMDEKAPPKNLRVSGGGANASVILNWDAPCAVVGNPIVYNLNFREVNLNHTFASTNVVNSSKPKLSYQIIAPYGGRYEVTVSTNVNGARPSQPAMFDGIPIPPPRMLHQCTACTGPTVYWEPPELPQQVLRKGNVSYVVWLSEDESFTKARTFFTSETSIKLDGVESEHIYYVAVSVKDAEGLQSILSEHIAMQYLDDTTPPGEISMSETNAVGIIVTVVIVISLLVAALGVFFVRHRRLQVSFLNFASSHYSTSSGAAIFQQSVEEEMDSPVIRGFSDDEPLLVA